MKALKASDTIESYTMPAVCPKCGENADIYYQYCRGDNNYYLDTGVRFCKYPTEHIHILCRRCHYTWAMACVSTPESSVDTTIIEEV